MCNLATFKRNLDLTKEEVCGGDQTEQQNMNKFFQILVI